MAAPQRWVCISEPPGNAWILLIWNAAREAVQRRAIAELPQDIRELGPHSSTRLNILPGIWRRLRDCEDALVDEVAKRKGAEHDFTAVREGFGLVMAMGPVYDFIAAANASPFETHACCELMRRVMSRTLIHTRNPRAASLKCSDLRNNSGQRLRQQLVRHN